ncbi:MAG: hypothetical protein WBZ07_04460 [Candidatus Dormiibacterota bacterium]
MEGGFRLVERVTTGQTSSRTAERSAEAEVATPGLLNFFKLGLSGKLGKSTSEGASETTEADRTHTYGSLLHRLRQYLIEESLVTTVASGGDVPVKVGSFIEFTGVVRPNPFTDSFRKLQRMMRFGEIALSVQPKPTPTVTANKGNRGQSQARREPPNQQGAQLKAMNAFFEQLTGDVEREGTSTVLFEDQASKYRAVVTIFDEFLRDRSMAEILNREFRVLGKVARHLPAGSTESVDLLASSGVAGFPPEMLGQLSGMIDQMSTAGQAQLESPSTTIEPPVIEIVPIAIYL